MDFDAEGNLREPDGKVYHRVPTTEYQKVQDELRLHLDDIRDSLERDLDVDEQDFAYVRGLFNYLQQAEKLSSAKADWERVAILSDRLDQINLQKKLLLDDVLAEDRNDRMSALDREWDVQFTELVELRVLARVADATEKEEDNATK